MRKRDKIVLVLAVLIGLGFIMSGFSVGLDPRESIKLVMFSMTFPVWIAAMVVITVVALIVRSKIPLIVLAACWVIGWYNVCIFSPWNLPKQPKEKDMTLSLLTYNVFDLNLDDNSADLDYNPTLSSIINSGADIVVVQETETLDRPRPLLHTTEAQYDSLFAIYPFHSLSPSKIGILSKYSFENIPIPEQPSGTASFAAYRINLPGGKCYLFNVHLQSFRLNTRDREAYMELTDGEVNRQALSKARRSLLPKVRDALMSHASEAEMLGKYIDSIAPEGRVIVCGDFNDIPGSYPISYLMKECNLKDAFSEGAFGPTYTYHNSRFYFNIDHILYRDFGRPYFTKRIKVPCSDHYPVYTIFPLTEE